MKYFYNGVHAKAQHPTMYIEMVSLLVALQLMDMLTQAKVMALVLATIRSTVIV